MDSPAEALEVAVVVPGDLLGVVLSILLIGLCGAISLLVVKCGEKTNKKSNEKSKNLYSEIARKIVHIGVSNWFFIYFFAFKESFWAIVGLLAFALFNAVLNVSGALGVLFHQPSKKRNWGMVYYPLSVVVLLLLVENGIGDKVCLGCALLGMGYGDGLAAIIGMKFGKNNLIKNSGCNIDVSKTHGHKTFEGSATMFAVVLIIFIILKVWLGGVVFSRALFFALLAAFVATIAEAFTPHGLDNVSVPLLIFLVSMFA